MYNMCPPLFLAIIYNLGLDKCISGSFLYTIKRFFPR
jgi:hypothetical protein